MQFGDENRVVYKMNPCYDNVQDLQNFNVFFKFPMRNEEMLDKEYDANLKAYDYIMEPVGECYDYFLPTENIKNTTQTPYIYFFSKIGNTTSNWVLHTR